MKLFLFVPLLLSFHLSAQTAPPSAPPSDVEADKQKAEEAVRAQAKRYYDLLIAGKPRATEELVCEASRDAYYGRVKRKPIGAEVGSVELAPDLKSAKVAVLVEDAYAIGLEKKVMRMPIPTDWKLENGQWCYYIPTDASGVNTPFGNMHLGAGASGPPGTAPGIRPVKPEDLGAMAGKVNYSKQGFQLRNDADGRDEVVISNGMPGVIGLDFTCPAVDGLVCKLDKKNVSQGGDARFSVEFKYSGTKLRDRVPVTLWVLPFRREVTFWIVSAPAPSK